LRPPRKCIGWRHCCPARRPTDAVATNESDGFDLSEHRGGLDAGVRKGKAQFLAVAQGSLAETETFLTLCEEIGWFPASETERLRALLTEIGKMLTTMRRNFRDHR
jgi:hypothetical protein